MKTQTLIAILVAILALAGLWYYFSGIPEGATPADTISTGNTTNTTSGSRIAGDAIYVPDQKPGDSVNIGLVDIQDGGYVVIHEADNGVPGAIVGASVLLSSGEKQNVEVNVSRELDEGEEFIAMLHNDNGDGTFNAADDAPVQDENGNVIFMRFMVSVDAGEPGGVISL